MKHVEHVYKRWWVTGLYSRGRKQPHYQQHKEKLLLDDDNTVIQKRQKQQRKRQKRQGTNTATKSKDTLHKDQQKYKNDSTSERTSTALPLSSIEGYPNSPCQ
eukprot:11632781-Ditylum_brightwellii.AAC.1